MKVIVYYPKDEKDIAALAKKVADVHIAAATSYLRAMACPKEQKLELVDSVTLNNG